MGANNSSRKAIATLSDQRWRLNNLYWITDKQGKRVKFRMNDAQAALFEEMWYLNVILKARQRGYTTFIDLYILDSCLFNRDTKAGIIAHNLEDAKVIFRDKIQYPYRNLDPKIRELIPASNERAGELVFGNGSSIRVSTSYRSGTLQILHVSEFGKIAAKYPEKAREIRTGAFEAVGQGQIIVVESTAEGREGDFYELSHRAQSLQQSGKELGHLDWKFHFAPWWAEQAYRTNPQSVTFTTEHLEYFRSLEERGITLDAEQRAWWVKKQEVLREDMKREHPSYPEEAFEASVEGSYYGRSIMKARTERRIGRVPYEPALPVNTFWDLGLSDTMVIWFHQQYGQENRLIDYYQVEGEGLQHCARILAEKGYVYGTHYMPHDVAVRELGSNAKSRQEVAEGLGIRPIHKVRRAKNQDEVLDGIEAVRNFLNTCWIDEPKCDQGIKALENYRKEWDDKLATYKRTPLHNWASHGADALRTGASGYENVRAVSNAELMPEPVADF